MALATSSSAHSDLHSLESLAGAIAQASAGRPIAMLAVRVPAFEQVAWQSGRADAQRLERRTVRAFLSAARRIVRADDALAHDAGADTFVVAMLAAPREQKAPSPADCRSMVERIALAIAQRSGLAVESGWCVVSQVDPRAGLMPEIEGALERGARERERYGFFAAIGHELRTPLTSIRGYLDTLLDDDLDAQTRQAFLQTARRETLRLGRLVDGMLDFSLLDLSSADVLALSCDVREAIGVACDAVAPQARERGVTVLAQPGPSVRVGLGGDACVQAILNVLDNAVKYGRTGGLICIWVAQELSFACVRVDDDGAGVALAESEAIFSPCVRGSAARGAGRGIGLAIVKTIVERAGGDVSAGPSPLGGASFVLRLPLRGEAIEAESALSAS
ncbi:MAG TPA: HAMP domain-containing sensor histidine kinase [Verrucomicrobiae bacterium]|jgi:signal transduction histidine kinase|nr:HAMP domain-containing sensor histidine kinase [Verrucomicrobiae bacterium]